MEPSHQRVSQQHHTGWLHDLGRIFFPHLCAGCGNNSIPRTQAICHRCLSLIPETHFASQVNNPVEMLFWGRLRVSAACSLGYYTRISTMQRIMHELKYQGNRDAGRVLGRLLGDRLLSSKRFQGIDIIIPMPLHPDKEKARGYNQTTMIGEGLQEVLGVPLVTDAVTKYRRTETQTRKNRMDRWQNVTGVFQTADPAMMQGKKILLVDDVVTTGASLEACGTVICQSAPSELFIATAAYAE